MANILQQRVNEVLKKYTGFLAELEFHMDAQKYLKNVIVEEKIEDESSVAILKELTKNTSFSIPRETATKAVAESLGISIVDFLSMPAETVEKFIEDKKTTLENEAITEFCSELKERMMKLELLRNPETFDALEFLAKVLIMISN